MGDYLYNTFENSWLRMTGLHHHDFPMLLWDALLQTSYGEEVLEYRGWLYTEQGMSLCEVHVDILSHLVFPDGCPWSMWVIRDDMDDSLEKAVHMALTAMCSQCLSDIAGMPIMLYPIQDHSNLEWKVCIDGACDIYQEHYHTGWAYMARYAQHMFKLPQDTHHTIVAQCIRLSAYAREVKALKLEIEKMGRYHNTLR
jgi:hypothetical protein